MTRSRFMKKLSFIVLSVLLLMAACITLAACGDETGEKVSLTVAEGTVYSHGEQTVELTFSSTENGAYTFEEDIDASDVTVSDGLAGKTVTEVVRADGSTLRVTLSGTVTGEVGSEGSLGSIVVSGGISENATGTALVYVYIPQMMAESVSDSNIGEKHTCRSTFVLPYGTFNEEYVSDEYITLPDNNGTLEVSLADGKLKVTVKDYTPSDEYPKPVVRIAPEVTTFNKELYVYIGRATLGVGSGWDLV